MAAAMESDVASMPVAIWSIGSVAAAVLVVVSVEFGEAGEVEPRLAGVVIPQAPSRNCIAQLSLTTCTSAMEIAH